MGISKKDDLELDFKGLRTDNYSSTVPYMGNLTADAKTLVNRLPQNNVKIGLFQDSENHDMYKMFEKNSKQINDNNFSETSPFISSDVYNNLVQQQKGGNDFSTSSSSSSSSSSESDMLRGGGKHDDSDESTTSESESESDSPKKHSKKHSKKNSKKSSESSDTLEDDLVDQMLSSNMSYESRTPSSYNSFISSSVNNKYHSDSEILSTISLNHKGRNNYTESINTSDINIISVDY